MTVTLFAPECDRKERSEASADDESASEASASEARTADSDPAGQPEVDGER